MGYNLYLHCHTCNETGFVPRGEESACISRWARKHSGHELDAAIDNGFAEKWFVDRTDPEPAWLGADSLHA